MSAASTAYLSLGSNLGDRYQNLLDALIELNERVGTIELISETYENPPSGFEADQDFLNLALTISTYLSPNELIVTLKTIETDLGREKNKENGYASRPIDIDIILFDDIILVSSELTIPHPHFKERMFVLRPLNDIAPTKIDPETKHTIAQLYHNCADQSILRLYKPQTF